MPSLRARLVNLFLRSKMKKLPLHEMDPVKVRRVLNREGPFLPKGVDIEPVEAKHDGGVVRGEWHRPASRESDQAMLYLHGGGYFFGSPLSHRSLTFPLALNAGAAVFSLDYRLGPEDPCPAAIEDAVTAYRWLVASGWMPQNISIAGDSAGGGLTLATMQALRDAGDPLPGAAVLYSPYTDLAAEGASIARNGDNDAMFHAAALAQPNKHYVGALDPKDPRCSPLYGEMAGLPPLLVFASTSEMLYDDSTRLVQRAQAEGVDVEFVERDGLPHIWPYFHPLMPEAGKDIKRSAAFIRARTGLPDLVSQP